MIRRTAALGCLLLAAAAPPAAPVMPVTTNYYGTKVIDDYRWMEQPNSPQLAAWMKAQAQYTRRQLDSLPGRAKLLADISQASNALAETGNPVRAGGRDFYLQAAPGQNTQKLYVREESTGAIRLLVDPDKMGANGEPAAINYFEPSQNGDYVAYGVSVGGSEAAVLHVIETATGVDQGIAIDRVQGDGFEWWPVWWLPDGKSFTYYRLQKRGPADPQSAFFLKSRVFLHHLGSNPNGDADTPVFGYNVTSQAPAAPNQDAVIVTQPGSDYAIGMLAENESFTTIDALYATKIADLAAGHPMWHQIAGKQDDITAFAAHGNRLYLIAYAGAPRFKIVATDIATPDLVHAAVVVPQTDAVIKSLSIARDGLYVMSTQAGMSQLALLPFTGNGEGPEQTVPLPFAGTVDGISTDPLTDVALFTLESWTRPLAVYAYNGHIVTQTPIQPPAKLNVSNLTSREVEAPSYDGTMVPLSIIMKQGTQLNGRSPALLIGYGSYGLTLSPEFLTHYIPWLERGGIVAVAHVRGGGWFGEGWHEAGEKLTKLNTIFDFIWCGQYLVEHHYTSPAYLGGEGGSAGGITIGGAINWRPGLFAAAIDSHGETDTLRSEFTPNGPPNIIEFGSVTTEPGFHGLYLMSAYANIRDGVKYPAVLAVTGANDPRVEPWEVAKYAARLQAASAGGKPVLLRVDYASGHGMGSTKSQDNEERADELAFLLWQFGAKDFQPAK